MTPYPTQGPKNYYFLFFKLDFKFSLILQNKKIPQFQTQSYLFIKNNFYLS